MAYFNEEQTCSRKVDTTSKKAIPLDDLSVNENN
jgi:hypothetical protein